MSVSRPHGTPTEIQHQPSENLDVQIGPEITRRLVVGGLPAALVVGSATVPLFGPRTARAATQVASGRLMAKRALSLVATLSPDQRQAVSFPFGGKRFQRWNYMTGSAFSPGLPLERMTKIQKTSALDLLSAGLSKTGFDKANRVMLQQEILRDLLRKGTPDRNRERFSVMLFGQPSATTFWGWRWEGHHLSLTYTLKGHDVVSVTPNSFSSEPNTVSGGPHKGMIALPDEERLGRTLFGDLSARVKRTSLIGEMSPGNVLATAGRENEIKERRGVPWADLSSSQRDLVLRLVDVYTSDHLPADLAAVQRARIREGDLMSARFAWAGDETNDRASIYYRIHGDAFFIEFASLFGQPLHLHTAVHDRERNFAQHLRG